MSNKYKCEVCGREFDSKQALAGHAKVHKGNNKKQVQSGRGLDVGTAFVQSAQKIDSEVKFKTQRNAFFDIESSKFVRNILDESEVRYIQSENRIYVVGDDSIEFANVFGKSTRRPLKSGVVSSEETEALPVVKLIIKSVLGAPSENDELVYYSVPGTPVDADFDTIYHQNVIKGFLEQWGYDAKPINEGLAVIFSELADNDFTGMGISLGGGMANICLSILSTPVFSFSVAKAGDWIDEQVAGATNTPVSKVTTFKEENFDLNKSESEMSKVEQALSIYYNHLIEYILNHIKEEITGHSSIPEFEDPIPMVISGGTVIPAGFADRFREKLEENNFPLDIRGAELAPQPLQTVAKGALIAAMVDNK